MLQVQHWERHLLDLAHQALESELSTRVHAREDEEQLAYAYQQCRTITRDNSKTFYLASSLMPKDKRAATQALYAFCRVSDDIVDCPDADAAARMESWRQQVVFGAPAASAHSQELLVRLAWADVRVNFGIPRGYVEQLIDGLAQDLRFTRYQTFADLARYCYGVACTVGLMSMHISGFSGREAFPYAIRLGVALQLTNILRDVGEDWRAGRLYLPLDELSDFGLGEADIAAAVEEGIIDHRWNAFMRSQITRAHRLYAEALPGVALLEEDGRFAIAAAGELYRGILDQIEANHYDVFSRRASLGWWSKLSRLPGIWWRAQNASA